MQNELLILRHGKSDWSADAGDFDRPLKDRGKRGAQRMGVWLLDQDLVPDHIVSSPAERARVTAEKAVKAMGLGAQGIRYDQRVYEAGISDLLDALGDSPAAARRVMIVGHNPGLEMLVGYLVEQEIAVPDDGKLLPTATLARLTLAAGWGGLRGGCARLESITRPSQLPKKFPFPAPGSDELRDRPAYYYTQSSVIPYRLNQGQLEIMVVSSSQKKHLVVPKGIKDPGLTPQQSAAKEALEEAGVEGLVADAPIGRYDCQKWGGTCSVEVYPMEVTRVLPEDEWEERHRGRNWVSPETAAEGLKEQALVPMVYRLAELLAAR